MDRVSDVEEWKKSEINRQRGGKLDIYNVLKTKYRQDGDVSSERLTMLRRHDFISPFRK